jgi:LuxR family maltose regulon positive regulatory protein
MSLPPSSRDPALVLKSTPPRAARGFIERERLSLERLELAGARVIAVLAPSGFGKTSQLTQWRREALARGALACWLSLDARDEPLRFVHGLAFALQAVSGKRGFDAPFMQWLEICPDPQTAMTGWLAEVASMSIEVLVVLDDVEQLPTQTRTDILGYLLGNAPANLRVVLGARPTGALTASGAFSMTSVTRVTASDLRFGRGETLAVLSAALGNRATPEAGVRLHELTEGWPLGVQLAVAALHRSGDLDGLLSTATADIQRYFLDTLIDRQPADTVHLLVRIAQFDLIHPDLCAFALGTDIPAQDLLRLRDETPLLLQAEGVDWMRVHPRARDALQERLANLPLAERKTISMRASVWYADHGLNEDAAHQARLGGDVQAAFALVERSVHQMTVQGRSAAVLEWFHHLSPEEVRLHPSFWVPAAWALAMSDRYAEAEPLLTLMLAQPELSVASRFEIDLIRATVAGYSDNPDRLADLVQHWPESPREARPDELPIYAVSKAFHALYLGQPDQARLHWRQIALLDRTQAYSPSTYGFADYGVGLSYLWEGRCALAEQGLRPALLRAEERMDRRNPVACMLAAMLAEACWECGQSEESANLLALRLDVLERHGLPEAIMSAYRTLAQLAEQSGRQDTALSLLEALRGLGEVRGMLRMQAAALYELVKLHARNGRADSAQALCAQLTALLDSHRARTPRAFTSWLSLYAELARAHAALAHADDKRVTQALQAAEAAISLAASLKRGKDGLQARLLRAEALRRSGTPGASASVEETLSLAQAGGMLRLIQEQRAPRHDTHGTTGSTLEPSLANATAGATGVGTAALLVSGTGFLTAKERDVLGGLTHNLSNKEIALAMGVSEQTIKWHLKNLFTKLNAGSRKHAVARARMLGLISA